MEQEFHSYGLDNNRSVEVMSAGPSVYTFQTEHEPSKPVYPWAPTTRIQKGGASVAENLVDVDSELMNLTRKLSNNPREQYQPGQGFQPTQPLQDGHFHQDSSRLTNNAQELRGTGWNRWEPLFFDPQKNSVEPFRRLGTNTVLDTLDESLGCSVQNQGGNGAAEVDKSRVQGKRRVSRDAQPIHDRGIIMTEELRSKEQEVNQKQVQV